MRKLAIALTLTAINALFALVIFNAFQKQIQQEHHFAMGDISYQNDVRPIFSDKCMKCHSGRTNLPNLMNYKTAYTLRYSIKRRVETKNMPPFGSPKLSASELDTVLLWINTGASE